MTFAKETKRCLCLKVRGAVQGVGFRPFVFRLATEMRLTGWVRNDPQGVRIEVEGDGERLQAFLTRLEAERPPLASVRSITPTELAARGYVDFRILPSQDQGARGALILPDLATCPDCLRELFDAGDRRHRYPFLNCTHCGPRFSILLALPYDRPNTTMGRFSLCEDCRAEYEDPRNRRFHAQPTACPRCGPRLSLWDGAGFALAHGDDALRQTAETIRQGAIVALKGLGGFHLIVDARNDVVVQRLRERKRREAKPFALMYPSLDDLRRDAEISEWEARLLMFPGAPIVLVRRAKHATIAPSVAPGNPYLGAMLPYTPLHHLLLADLGFPIVATSGNRADEPICIDESEALSRLAGIADCFLVHDRPIARHMDDSVARMVLGGTQILRRARGYAPLPIDVDRPLPSVLALGGHLKNAVALSVGSQVFISQHIGDLETAEAAAAFRASVVDLPTLYECRPNVVACDLHPDYRSTHYADRQQTPVVRVQHHHAHVLACMAENGVSAPALGVAWDGTGYGTDGTIWGGEFFRVAETSITRVAHLRPFPLPGGEPAIREPRRAALGLLHAMHGDDAFTHAESLGFSAVEREALRIALKRKINTPLTTSAGRLFDAVAALAGVRQVNRFEAEAAMDWEWRADGIETNECYRLSIERCDGGPVIIDWAPMVHALCADLRAGVPVGVVAARFHNAMGEAIVDVCRLIGERAVLLTGGCFLNRRLLERVVSRLRAEGFVPYWHQRVPTGDGGIALGQIIAAAR